MAKVNPPPACLFRYNHAFHSKQFYRKQSSDSVPQIMKIFIFINYIYFGCLAVLFLYDVLFYKAFPYGRFVLTNCFKKCSGCNRLRNREQEGSQCEVSFLLPPPSGSLCSRRKFLNVKEDSTSNSNVMSKNNVKVIEIPASKEDLMGNFVVQNSSVISKTKQPSNVNLRTSVTQTILSGLNFDLLPDFMKNILYRGGGTELVSSDGKTNAEMDSFDSKTECTTLRLCNMNVGSPYEDLDWSVFNGGTTDSIKVITQETIHAPQLKGANTNIMEGIVIDELNKIHILDPQIFEKTEQLKNEASHFVDAVTSFQKIVNDLINAAEKIGEEVEKEKLKAIGSRNFIKSLTKRRENLQSELQSLIIEKSLEIERQRVEHESLLRTQAEQQEVLDGLLLNA